MTDFIAYHDRRSVDHQNHFDRLFPQGYRIITLSVYGARGDERYGRPNPQWEATQEETAKIAALGPVGCDP